MSSFALEIDLYWFRDQQCTPSNGQLPEEILEAGVAIFVVTAVDFHRVPHWQPAERTDVAVRHRLHKCKLVSGHAAQLSCQANH